MHMLTKHGNIRLGSLSKEKVPCARVQCVLVVRINDLNFEFDAYRERIG
jgi:hypothetical protein